MFVLLLAFALGASLWTDDAQKPVVRSARAQQAVHSATCVLQSSDIDSVTARLEVSGVDMWPENLDGETYQRLELRGTSSYGRDGAPDVPVYRTLVAIPDCDGVVANVRVASSTRLQDIRIYPKPQAVFDPVTQEFEERVVRDASIYDSDADFPGQWAWIERIDRMRGQRVATVAVCPVQVNPVRGTLAVATRLDVRLAFENPRSPLEHDIGPMRNVLHGAALNYTLTDLSAPVPRGKTGGPMATTAVGSVYWCGTPNDDWEAAADSVALVGEADYVILMADNLDSALVDTLATYRADRDGFNVSIVRLPQLDSSPDTEGTPDTIRSFVKRVYEHKRAAHMSDSLLAYFLLVGDAYDANDAILLPSYYGYTSESQKASDAYYTFLDSTGENDLLADVFLGRLPVNLVDGEDPDIQLVNVVHKITGYGLGSGQARKNLMVSGDLYGLYTLQQADAYFSAIVSQYVEGNVDTTHVLHRLGDPSSDVEFSSDLGDQINEEDYWMISIFGHGNPMYAAHTFFPAQYGALTNDFPSLFLLAGCDLGQFDLRSGEGVNCGQTGEGIDPCDAMAEALLVEPHGAIGAIGWTRWASLNDDRYACLGFYASIFQDNAHRLGEILLGIRLYRSLNDTSAPRALALFGDPAVDIMWQQGTDTSAVDLAVRPSGVRLPDAANDYYVDGTNVYIEVDVQNVWRTDADSVYLVIREVGGGDPLDSTFVGPVGAYDQATYTGSVALSHVGPAELSLEVGTTNGRQEVTEQNNELILRFTVLNYESGYPVSIDGEGTQSVIIADADAASSGKEVLVATTSGTTCYLASGSQDWSMPNVDEFFQFQGSPLVGNVRKDGHSAYLHRGCVRSSGYVKDVVVVDGGTGEALDTVATQTWAGTQFEHQHGLQTVLLSDLHTDDDALELLLLRAAPSSGGYYVECYSSSGSLGEPLWSELFDPTGSLKCQMGVADIDNDGDIELAIRKTNDSSVDSLVVFDLEGNGASRRWARQITGSTFTRIGADPILICDRNKNGMMEILTVAAEYLSGLYRTHVMLLSPDNAVLEEDYFEGESPFCTVAPVGDSLDVVLVAGNQIRLCRSSSNFHEIETATIDGTFVSAPLIADVTGDDNPEIITVHEWHPVLAYEKEVHMTIYSSDLSVVEGPYVFPHRVDGWNTGVDIAGFAMPAVDDIDGDGVTECAFVSSDGLLHVFEIGNKHGRVSWPQRYQNPMQTNLIEQPLLGTYDNPVSLFNQVRVLGDVSFDSTLYVDPTARIEVAPEDATQGGEFSSFCEINLKGASQIRGTVVSPIQIYGDPALGDSLSWVGLSFDDTVGVDTLTYCVIAGAKTAISSQKSLHVTNVTIDGSGTGIVATKRLQLRDSDIASTAAGVVFADTADVDTVTQCTISGAQTAVSSHKPLYVSDLTVVGSEAGIVTDKHILLQDSDISAANVGISLTDTAGVDTLTHCTVSDAQTAISSQRSLYLLDITIEESDTGIVVTRRLQLRESNISANNVGISLNDTAGVDTIAHCTFSGSQKSISSQKSLFLANLTIEEADTGIVVTKRLQLRDSNISATGLGVGLNGTAGVDTIAHCTISGAEVAISSHDSLYATALTIEGSETGITSDGDLTLRGSRIAATTYVAVEITGGTAALDVDTLSASGALAYGLDVQTSSDDVVCDSSLVQNTYQGVRAASSGAKLQLTRATVTGCDFGAYLAYSAHATVDSCSFSGNDDGVFVYSNGQVTVQNSLFDDNDTDGIMASNYSSIEITGNTFQNETIGVYCYDHSSPTITSHNIFKSSVGGVKSEAYSNPTIRGNEFRNNSNGAGAIDHGFLQLGAACGASCGDAQCSSEGANSFERSTYHISNFTDDTVPAECNWFGEGGPRPGTIYGPVDYTPYRTSDPFPVSPYRPDDDKAQDLPSRYALYHGCPNPFNPAVSIRYDVPTGARVTITVYNVLGQQVTTLVDEFRAPGRYVAEWMGNDERGTPVASGVYFVRMQSDRFGETKKVTLLK